MLGPDCSGTLHALSSAQCPVLSCGGPRLQERWKGVNLGINNPITTEGWAANVVAPV